MWKAEVKRNLKLFLRAGLPYTLVGAFIILSGIFVLKKRLAGSDYQTAALFIWLGLFWFVYQPLFRKRIRRIHSQAKPE